MDKSSSKGHFSWENRVWSRQNCLCLRKKYLCNLKTADGKWSGGDGAPPAVLMELKGEMEELRTRAGNLPLGRDFPSASAGLAAPDGGCTGTPH